jgi:hypothetical protein
MHLYQNHENGFSDATQFRASSACVGVAVSAKQNNSAMEM